MAENWTRLAEAIGMVRTTVNNREGFWKENRPDLDSMSGPYDNRNPPVHEVALPAYLMEPAQTARILARFPLHLSPVEGNLYVVARYNVNGGLVRECGPVCEAVARCAARCLA